MSFYVKRRKQGVGHRTAWTGPIRSERQAAKEAVAWRDAGWDAEAVPSSPEVKRAVFDWRMANQR